MILFQCMTGRVPFAGEELGDVLVAICTDDIPLASQLSPELGPEVDRFLMRALTRTPAERFQTARELAEAFASMVAAPPATARVVSDPTLVTGPPAPALPVSVSVPAVTAPSFAPVGPPPSGTLAPSMATFSAPPGRTRLTVALAALSTAVIALVVTAAVVLRGPEAAATADAGPPSVQGNAAPVASAVPSPATAVPPAPSATTAPPAPSATSARRPVPSVPRSVPSPGTSRRPSHDPLDHR